MRLALKTMMVALPFGIVYSWNLSGVPEAGDSVTLTTNITNTSSNFAFHVEQCGQRATEFLALIQAAIDTLPAVINDLQSGINSRHGYKAWFKGNDSSQYIQKMLQDVYTAQPRMGLLPFPELLTGPRFVCATPTTIALYPWMRYNPFSICVAQIPGTRAFYYGLSSYILICPYFWSMQPSPPRSFCPTVRRNRFVGEQTLLSEYRTYVLIHEMLHFYLGINTLSPSTVPREQYELNDCVALDKQDSLRNPANYQNYIAMVQQSCTEFPNPNQSPFPLAEGNSTASDTSSNSSLPLASSNTRPIPTYPGSVQVLPQATSLAVPNTQNSCNLGLGQALNCAIPPIGDS